MAVNNAYKLCLALLKQDSTSGSVFTKLKDSKDKLLKWNTTSIIPVQYDFTNFQVGDATVETVEKNVITELSKAKKFESGAITPPTYTFANMAPVDASNVIGTLNSLTAVDDPFRVLLLAGVYKQDSTGTRTYDVFMASVCILTSDGGRSGEAKQPFTGSLALQGCDLPLIGVTDIATTLSLDTSTLAVTASFPSSGSNPT